MRTNVPWTISLHSCLPNLGTVVPGGRLALKWASVCHGTDHSDQIAIYNGHSRDLISCIDSSEVDLLCVRPNQLLSLLSVGLNIQREKEYERHETIGVNGDVTVFFRDGTTAQGTIIVGCDGAQSQGTRISQFFVIITLN